MRLTRGADSVYAWLIVTLGAISIAVQTGLLWAGAVFLIGITEETGWSRAAVAGALSLFVFGNGAWAPVAGWLIRGYGTRRVIPSAAFLLATGLLALSAAPTPLVFSAIILLLVSPGSIGIGSLPHYSLAQQWFARRRGLALGVVDAGAGLGLAAVVPLSQTLIADYGWRVAYQVLACLVLALIPLHLLLQRPPPLDAGLPISPSDGPDTRPAGIRMLLGSRAFWIVVTGLMLIWFVTSMIVVHHAAYLRDSGFEPVQIAAALGMLGTTGVAGRIFFGWLSDRVGVTTAYATVTACVMVGIGALVLAGTSGQLLPLAVFGAVFGVSMGVGTILFARRLVQIFGTQAFGLAMGLAFPCASIAGAAGSAGAGVAFELTGSYLTSFAAAAVGTLASCGCMWRLRPVASAEQEARDPAPPLESEAAAP